MFDEDFSLFDCACWYVVFLFSTTLHEASHALAALKLGDDTAHQAGQVTLDPIPHIRREPIGMVVVPLLSFYYTGFLMGWASAPYNPLWAERYPRRSALMAMAGPFSNLLLVLLAGLVIKLGVGLGWFQLSVMPFGSEVVTSQGGGIAHTAAVLLSIAFSLNMVLFCFNLLPLPPLDGSSLPLFFLSRSAAAAYTTFLHQPYLSLIGMVVAWKVFPAFLHPVQQFFNGIFF